MENNAPAFTITRIFAAPREKIFKAWTEVEHLRQWWGPAGFTMLACKIDLRPGGIFHFGMRAPGGAEMWGKWVFNEIVPPEKLVFSAFFSNAEAGVTRHPFAPVWPAETLSTLTLTEAAGHTTLTLHGTPRNASPEEQKAFHDAYSGMNQGWTGTLDQLAKHLEPS